ncbi:Leucine-rich repeat neuronal protein 1-like protein [Aphelenchoides besseyi]|nr:Leucine-rich repeat neuronal protein 1-like protein [Aphelenchoides besseyi]KAI6198482.1 Leucine-rich repeat neuronal protein 1-like protein [Aphelenchoides besseyi]
MNWKYTLLFGVFVVQTIHGYESKVLNLCREYCFCNWNLDKLSCSDLGINLTIDRNVRIGVDFNVKTVDLSYNPTPQFNGERLFSHREKTIITKLDLSRMKMNEFTPGSFNDFIGLKTLNLSGNQLTNYLGYTPENKQNQWLTEGRTLALETLDLSYNNFKKFPKELSTYFPNLRKLDLSHNRGLRLVDLDPMFYTFNQLEELRLDNCDLTTIDGPFFELVKNVRVLSLTNNPIQFFPEALKHLERLEVLDLSKTEIRWLKTFAFDKNHNLQKLVMQNSALEEVKYCAFCGGLKLTEIDFKGSYRLSKIDSFDLSFARLWDLRNCNLSTLTEQYKPSYNYVVKLGGNPWYCDYRLNWTVRLSYDCVNPYDLRGRTVQQAMQQFLQNRYETTTSYAHWNWRYPYRASSRVYNWNNQYDDRPFWEVDSRAVEQWWSKEASPFIQRLMREPLTFFVVGAISSAVLLLLFWCGCQLCCCGLSCLFGRVKRKFKSLDCEPNAFNYNDDKEPLIGGVLRTPIDRARQLQKFLATRGANLWNFDSSTMRQHINDVLNDEDTETVASVISTETTPIDEMEQCRWTSDRPCAVTYEKK